MERAEDKSIFNTEQAFMTYAAENINWWPERWVNSFKWNLRPSFPFNLFKTPASLDGKILVFHGKPDPEEAVNGFHGTRSSFIKPVQWIEDY